MWVNSRLVLCLNRIDQRSPDFKIQALESSQKTLGAEHPHTLIYRIELVSIYEEQNRLQEAEALQVQVLEARKGLLVQSTLEH